MGNIVARPAPTRSRSTEHKVAPSEQVTIDMFRPIASLGHCNFGSMCVAERKSDSRFFSVHHCLKYKSLRDNLIHAQLLERDLLQDLEHALVAKLYWSFQNDAYLYMVFDHFEGGNLQTISLGKQWKESELVSILAETCSALLYIHSKGIIHRDIRPKNIYLDILGHAILSDFGLAVKTQPTESTKGLIGTEPFDFWSLGVSLYETVFKELPFQIQPRDAAKAQLVSFPDWIRSSKDMQSLISGLLTVDAKERLGSSGEGTSRLYSHAFFQDVDWDLVELRGLRPIFLPKPSRMVSKSDYASIPEMGNGRAALANAQYFELPQERFPHTHHHTHFNPFDDHPLILNEYEMHKSRYAAQSVIDLAISVKRPTTIRRQSSPNPSIMGMKSARNSVVFQPSDSILGFKSLADSTASVESPPTQKSNEGSLASAVQPSIKEEPVEAYDPNYPLVQAETALLSKRTAKLRNSVHGQSAVDAADLLHHSHGSHSRVNQTPSSEREESLEAGSEKTDDHEGSMEQLGNRKMTPSPLLAELHPDDSLGNNRVSTASRGTTDWLSPSDALAMTLEHPGDADKHKKHRYVAVSAEDSRSPKPMGRAATEFKLRPSPPLSEELRSSSFENRRTTHKSSLRSSNPAEDGQPPLVVLAQTQNQ
ncbi:hypothetical protein HDU91_005834 [Kappamyces sp. JEL0680]|nr:hypothetical protein HDU91_005834 [Kappamyces sp. JEL0680]